MSKLFTENEYIADQVAFFKAQGKPSPRLLGMEFEHFLVDEETLRSYSYFEKDGQRDLFQALTEKGWAVFSEEDGNILGIAKDGHTLTLEPGGQVEISLKAYDNVAKINAAYQGVLNEVSEALKQGQRIVSLGYHPVSKIAELPLLPKKRYAMMYDYFKNNGQYCHNMMKGTAATQVSIDFKDEADFIRKFRVANYLSPALASLFDSTPIFEGDLYPAENCRLKIWDQTDIKRSKLIPGSMDKLFGFSDYASYLLQLPPILIQSEGAVTFSNNVLLKDLLKDHPLTPKDLEHLQSMVFPDVRLKRFIEIRMPDAMPHPYHLAVAAIIKGIFYNEEQLEYFYQQSLAIDDAWVKTQNRQLIDAVHGSQSQMLMRLKAEVLERGAKGLSIDEAAYIAPFKALIEKEGSLTAYLRHQYGSDRKAFIETITVAKSDNACGGVCHD